MGGDHGLRFSLPAAVNSLQHFPYLHIILVGDADRIRAELPLPPARLSIVDAAQVVEMSDRPAQAMRKKQQSSMRIAINLLAEQQVDAVVSAGNTGALMAIGSLVLKTLPGIDRPAIAASVPARNGRCLLLDLGANVDCDAEQLRQFALMGSALVVAEGIPNPRVGLLNIGTESGKGNELVKAAADLLSREANINYCGFIEGDTLFHGGADVVVCDGFAGNIALKVCEGTASLIAKKLREHFTRNVLARIAGIFAAPVLRALYRELDPQQYNGACLLGLRGVVVKSHGNSSIIGFESSIARAVNAVEKNLLGAIARYSETKLEEQK
jgi:glycerol-3-phosphate acyltransferase PlsX